MSRVLLLVFSIAVAALSFAQSPKLSNPYSLEYLVDSSDLVVLGKVLDFDGKTVRVEVASVYKGEAVGTISVGAKPTEQEAKDLTEARKAGNDVLWFLAGEGENYRIDNLDDRTYGLTFSQGTRRIFPMDGGVYIMGLGKRLFDAVEKEAKLAPGRNDRFLSIRPPSWYGLAQFSYPLDSRIEKLAQTWVVPRVGRAERRLIGVQVLRHFRTPENEAILKGLVHDPGKIESFGGKSDFKSEAASVLAEWGVPIPPPPPASKPKQIGEKPIRVTVDGVEVEFKKGVSPPILIDGRAYARACSISEQLGVKMSSYHLESANGVQIDTSEAVIDMPFDARTIWVGNRTEDIAYPARLVRNEGFFPIRWFVEKMGGKVKWDAKRRIVEITTSDAA